MGLDLGDRSVRGDGRIPSEALVCTPWVKSMPLCAAGACNALQAKGR